MSEWYKKMNERMNEWPSTVQCVNSIFILLTVCWWRNHGCQGRSRTSGGAGVGFRDLRVPPRSDAVFSSSQIPRCTQILSDFKGVLGRLGEFEGWVEMVSTKA